MGTPVRGQVSGCGRATSAMAVDVRLQGYFTQVSVAPFESNCSQTAKPGYAGNSLGVQNEGQEDSAACSAAVYTLERHVRDLSIQRLQVRIFLTGEN